MEMDFDQYLLTSWRPFGIVTIGAHGTQRWARILVTCGSQKGLLERVLIQSSM